jgi:hypothetical protein
VSFIKRRSVFLISKQMNKILDKPDAERYCHGSDRHSAGPRQQLTRSAMTNIGDTIRLARDNDHCSDENISSKLRGQTTHRSDISFPSRCVVCREQYGNKSRRSRRHFTAEAIFRGPRAASPTPVRVCRCVGDCPRNRLFAAEPWRLVGHTSFSRYVRPSIHPSIRPDWTRVFDVYFIGIHPTRTTWCDRYWSHMRPLFAFAVTAKRRWSDGGGDVDGGCVGDGIRYTTGGAGRTIPPGVARVALHLIAVHAEVRCVVSLVCPTNSRCHPAAAAAAAAAASAAPINRLPWLGVCVSSSTTAAAASFAA